MSESSSARLTHTGQFGNTRRATETNAIMLAPAAITTDLYRLRRLVTEHGHQLASNEPKPWKKPWEV